MRKLLLFALISLCHISYAAENEITGQDSDQQEEAPLAPNSDQELQDDGGDLIASEILDTNDGEEETSVRFIPTEEISQDLGVSFPVDI